MATTVYFESPWSGGASRYASDVIRSLSLSGEIKVWATESSFSEAEVNEVRTVAQLQTFSRYPFYDLLHRSGRIRRWLRKASEIGWTLPDIAWSTKLVVTSKGRIVVVNGGYPGSRRGIALAVVGLLFRRRVTLFVLSVPRERSLASGPLGFLLDRFFARRGLNVVVNSASQASMMSSRRRWPTELVHVCRNSCRPTTNLIERKTSRSADSVKVLYFGRLDRLKGVHELIDSVARLRSEEIRVHLTFAGEGPERGHLEASVARLGLSNSVTFLGFVAPADDSFFADYDIGALPSHWEGLPFSVLDMMAAALPVVASAVGGVPEVIEDGVSGLLVAPSDPGALTEALRKLALDADLRSRVGSGAHLAARTFLNFDQFSETVRVLVG